MGEVATIVKTIMSRIKDAVARRGHLVSFDFSGDEPQVMSIAIQRMLTGKGYVAVVVLGSDGSERMYIDLTRQRVAASK